MVKKHLERVDIPYETPEGIADFHAAGRHSHITGLVKSGVSIMQAKELARHADIRQTAKYTHIGMKDQAAALENLPSPIELGGESCLHIVCTPKADETDNPIRLERTQAIDKTSLTVNTQNESAPEIGVLMGQSVCEFAPETFREVIQIGDIQCHLGTSSDDPQYQNLEEVTQGIHQAEASGNELVSDLEKCLHIVCTSGGVESPEVSSGGTEENDGDSPLKAQTPAIAGVVSSGAACRQELASAKKVEAAGIAPASRDPSVRASTCVSRYLVFVGKSPTGRVFIRLSSHVFSPERQPAVILWPARIGVSEHDSRAEVILRSFVTA